MHFKNAALCTATSRKTLLMAVMAYLRDIQYTTYMTPTVPLRDRPVSIKLHPFLSPVELSTVPIGASPFLIFCFNNVTYE